MSGQLRAAAGAAVAGFAFAFCSFATAAELSAPRALSDIQLDGIAAGARAFADGTGQSDGRKAVQSSVELSNYVLGTDATSTAAAAGQVSASATASAGGLATASSSLSLTATL
jgi:hypothetical protein